MSDRFQRGVRATVFPVSRVQRRHRFRSRIGRRRDMHGFVTRRIHIGPDRNADARKERRAERRAFIRDHRFHWMSVDIGLNLPPQRRAGSTASQSNLAERDTEVGKNRERISQAERDAFQHGARDVTARVACGQPEKRGPHVRIKVWRPLTHEIRHPHHTVSAWRNRRRFRRQLLVPAIAG